MGICRVEGALPPPPRHDERSECAACTELCGDGPGIVDLRCCWCQSTVHIGCVDSVAAGCTFGAVAAFVMPPRSVQLRTMGARRLLSRHRTHVIERVARPTELVDWTPVIVMANPKSGNGSGELVLQRFRRVLNPCQVVDLNRVPPDTALRWLATDGAEVRLTVLVAGGDGTVQWVLNSIEKLQLSIAPNVRSPTPSSRCRWASSRSARATTCRACSAGAPARRATSTRSPSCASTRRPSSARSTDGR